MLLPQETFRADCVSWNGYKPCSIQKAENRPDCFGCGHYETGPAVIGIDHQPFDAEILKTANAIGIVEMGGLGSVLRTTAVTRAIREVNPNTSIAWFTHQRGAELLKYTPGVVAIDVESTDADEQSKLIASLDTLLNFELTNQAKSIVAQANIIGGFALNAQGKFHGVYPYAEYFQRLQVDDAFRKRNTLTMQEILLRSAGLGEQDARYDIKLRESNYDNAEQVLHRAFGSECPDEIIGLNIGTSDKGRLRRWPAKHHAALAKHLASTHPYRGVAILSGPQDDEVRNHVIAALGDNAPANLAVLPNNLEIGDFMGLLSKLRLVVTSDTFGMHAARAQNVPTIALAGPMPHRELELSSKDTVIGPQTGCSPCYHRCTHPIEGQCMKDISIELVAEQVDRILVTPQIHIPQQQRQTNSLIGGLSLRTSATATSEALSFD